MKKLVKFTAIGLLFLFAACGPSKEDAIKHNDSIVADQKEILALEDNLIGSIADWNYVFAASDLKVYQDKLNEYIKKYEDMKAFDKDDAFRLSMLQLLKGLKEQADGNYLLVLEIMSGSETMDELDDENYNALLDILDDVDLKSDEANNQFLDAQKKFAEQYDLQLK
jgi:hypothetical protein